MKTIFYGCGAESVVRHVCSQIAPQLNTSLVSSLVAECGGIAYCDSDSELWGTTYLGLPVIAPTQIQNTEYERIVITACAADAIYRYLTGELGISPEKIIAEPAKQIYFSRTQFVHAFAAMAKKRDLHGDVAEGGVYQGNFAKEINTAFPESKLFLFDTFEGFNNEDALNDAAYLKTGRTHTHFTNTSVEVVLNKLPYPQKAVIRKGYFPESAAGINEKFIFVNLDFDLYVPIKAGLEFFYPKLVTGGVILIHDYFANDMFDTCKAVDEFCKANNIYPLPIGDVLSVAIVKQ